MMKFAFACVTVAVHGSGHAAKASCNTKDLAGKVFEGEGTTWQFGDAADGGRRYVISRADGKYSFAVSFTDDVTIHSVDESLQIGDGTFKKGCSEIHWVSAVWTPVTCPMSGLYIDEAGKHWDITEDTGSTLGQSNGASKTAVRTQGESMSKSSCTIIDGTRISCGEDIGTFNVNCNTIAWNESPGWDRFTAFGADEYTEVKVFYDPSKLHSGDKTGKSIKDYFLTIANGELVLLAMDKHGKPLDPNYQYVVERGFECQGDGFFDRATCDKSNCLKATPIDDNSAKLMSIADEGQPCARDAEICSWGGHETWNFHQDLSEDMKDDSVTWCMADVNIEPNKYVYKGDDLKATDSADCSKHWRAERVFRKASDTPSGPCPSAGPTTLAPTKPTTDKPTTDKPTTDKPTTDKPTTDKPTTDKPTTSATPTTAAPTAPKCCWTAWGDASSCGGYPSGGSGGLCNTDYSKSCSSSDDCTTLAAEDTTSCDDCPGNFRCVVNNQCAKAATRAVCEELGELQKDGKMHPNGEWCAAAEHPKSCKGEIPSVKFTCLGDTACCGSGTLTPFCIDYSYNECCEGGGLAIACAKGQQCGNLLGTLTCLPSTMMI
jgi:hypothetical protein